MLRISVLQAVRTTGVNIINPDRPLKTSIKIGYDVNINDVLNRLVYAGFGKRFLVNVLQNLGILPQLDCTVEGVQE